MVLSISLPRQPIGDVVVDVVVIVVVVVEVVVVVIVVVVVLVEVVVTVVVVVVVVVAVVVVVVNWSRRFLRCRIVLDEGLLRQHQNLLWSRSQYVVIQLHSFK